MRFGMMCSGRVLTVIASPRLGRVVGLNPPEVTKGEYCGFLLQYSFLVIYDAIMQVKCLQDVNMYVGINIVMKLGSQYFPRASC